MKDGVADRLGEIEERVMAGLTDFQRATVERVDELFRSGQRRVLVSDEVGLGKTLVARGVLAKLAALRREEGDDLVKVVYICSNAAIAGQNLRRLRITGELQVDESSSSRLSMQHLNIFRQENDQELRRRYIQLIPLTPQTSFTLRNGGGMAPERALMAVFLSRMPLFRGSETRLRRILLLPGARTNDLSRWRWKRLLEDMEKEAKECNRRSGGRYFGYMQEKLAEAAREGPEEENAILRLAGICRERRGTGRENLRDVVSDLRRIFARISVEKLEPDLVIMDEFQRFRTLLELEADSEEGLLARRFFQSGSVRMLLLSATPYKMYSTPEEIEAAGQDESSSDFLSLMDFLNDEPAKKEAFRRIWDSYSGSLRELSLGGTTVLTAARRAEEAMYRTICRTERLAEPACADAFDDSGARGTLRVLPVDIASFLEAQEALNRTASGMRLPADYVKSAPYLLSFMRDYQVKRVIERHIRAVPGDARLLRKKTLWIRKRLVDRYEIIPPGNARLAAVRNLVLPAAAERLLWIPPSRPWYEPSGVFEKAGGWNNPTKTLIFSSWEMVPRMLACLLSYEAERRTTGRILRKRGKEERHLYVREKRVSLMRLKLEMQDAEKPVHASLKLFSLLYPSTFLADAWDPSDCLARNLPLNGIREEVRGKIEARLSALGLPEPRGGQEDGRWYALVPMLLDSDRRFENWRSGSLRSQEPGEDGEETGSGSVFARHLETLGALRAALLKARDGEGACPLTKRPADLTDTLVDMALASPAVCLLRTYDRFLDGGSRQAVIAGEAARRFLRRMNTPEASAVMELSVPPGTASDPCLRLLRYCRDGNLQAVFDEYAHLLSGGIEKGPERLEQIHAQMLEGLEVPGVSWKVDSYDAFVRRTCGRKKDDEEKMPHIRTHFAMAFSKGDGGEEDAGRKVRLRNVFNSPFWPFVLATTSVGQEGLDFHQYCRRVVHWNLPSNPVDLEQREGRVNRYKCLAVRQTVAARYGKRTPGGRGDVWEEIFAAAARAEKGEESSDLIPCWGLRPGEDLVRVERVVPMYPLSRDRPDYARLIQILSLYRLTLGQPRQEDLLESLLRDFQGDEESLKELFMNLAPFYRRKREGKTPPASREPEADGADPLSRHPGEGRPRTSPPGFSSAVRPGERPLKRERERAETRGRWGIRRPGKGTAFPGQGRRSGG